MRSTTKLQVENGPCVETVERGESVAEVVVQRG